MFWRETSVYVLPYFQSLPVQTWGFTLSFYRVSGTWSGRTGCLHRKGEKGLMTPPENRTFTKIKEILYFLFSDRKIHWQRLVHSRGSCKSGSTPLVETSMQIPVFNLAFWMLCEKFWQSLIIIASWGSWATHMDYNHISSWLVSVSWKHLEFMGLHCTNSLTKQQIQPHQELCWTLLIGLPTHRTTLKRHPKDHFKKICSTLCSSVPYIFLCHVACLPCEAASIFPQGCHVCSFSNFLKLSLLLQLIWNVWPTLEAHLGGHGVL